MPYKIHLTSNYLLSYCMGDPSAARGQAIIALGQTIEKQALIMSYSDALGAMLILAACLILLFKIKASSTHAFEGEPYVLRLIRAGRPHRSRWTAALSTNG